MFDTNNERVFSDASRVTREKTFYRDPMFKLVARKLAPVAPSPVALILAGLALFGFSGLREKPITVS